MATVLISGGTGMIGKALTTLLTSKGYEVIVLTRDAGNSYIHNTPLLSYANWDAKTGSLEESAIAKADYVIHLAGANVADKRWTDERKKVIVESRTKTSELLTKKISEVPNNIKAVISVSAIGWYGPDTPLSKKNGFTEEAPAAKDFLGEACRVWEESIEGVNPLGKRLVILRTGVVLSNTGGALAEFKKPLKFAVAGILGSGDQIVSWIHIDDICRLYVYAIENEITGVYNAAAPNPVNNKTLTLTLAKNMRDKFYIPVHVPAFALKIMLGELSTEVLKSTTINDQKIRNAGFDFVFTNIDAAVENLTATHNLL